MAIAAALASRTGAIRTRIKTMMAIIMAASRAW